MPNGYGKTSATYTDNTLTTPAVLYTGGTHGDKYTFYCDTAKASALAAAAMVVVGANLAMMQ